VNQVAPLVDTSSRASGDSNMQLKVMNQSKEMKMKMRPILSTIVQEKTAILPKKTVITTDLCICGDL
jgi:hypothetical protein